ncbi:MAG: PorP/SprF family type IX secretion system membrane protein [Bacteroidetes bacterium]|nr:PorP/SprF family type IX secretion system membrane protein [Bacteroidota bacterium]
MKKQLLILFLFFQSMVYIYAQDPYYSQLFTNRLYLNPALAGANKGLRIATIHRQLWPNVPGPLHTTGFALDLTDPGIGGAIGITAMNDNRGEGFLNTNQFGLIYAYRNLLGRRGNTEFSLASGVSMVNKSIDWTKLEFSDEFDPVLGKKYQSSAQQPANTSIFYSDFDFGFSLNHRISKYGRDSYIGWGGAMHHITRPDESFIGVHRRIPIKTSLYVGAMIPVKNFRSKTPTFFFPHATYIQQGQKSFNQVNFQAFQAGCFLYKDWYFVGIDYRNSPYTAGRNTDALIVNMGIHSGIGMAGSYQITYSLDVNLNGLGAQTWGSHEISLIFTFDEYRLGGANGGRKKPLNCFDFPHRGVFRMF